MVRCTSWTKDCIGPQQQKAEFVNTGAAKVLIDIGSSLYATKSTHEYQTNCGAEITCAMLYKPRVKRESIMPTMLQAGKIDIVINVPDSMDSGRPL
jgi:hypothetical protein